MINIIRSEKEVREYILGIKKLFELYKVTDKFNMRENALNSKLKHIISNLDKNEDYNKETLKGKILREHILEDKNLEDIAIETRYSVSYIYAQKLKILKEFAAMVFEVIIL